MEKTRFSYIIIGGFLGSALRELIFQYFQGVGGTLIVNVLGSFILGYLMYGTELGFFSERERYLAGIGFCGGLTTFSTFMLQTLQYSAAPAAWNISANIIACLFAVFAGRAMAMKGLGT
ncbi:MAG: fluoride efflux transporter CrcB [Candidatus Methanoperedens sp.]|nr:fluoride efflux transporter CrcB [Candidatus Methanoperedens sp.]MCZ7371975.1 fluoride efflux transporter CrcB [Candidatus Methanoperedens sp.]